MLVWVKTENPKTNKFLLIPSYFTLPKSVLLAAINGSVIDSATINGATIDSAMIDGATIDSTVINSATPVSSSHALAWSFHKFS